MFFANKRDLPQPWQPKRIIFYAQGLKVYGQIPYILQRRLGAQFFSNDIVLGGLFAGMRIVGLTAERNYTVVPYRRPDGSPHRETAVEALLNWLYADRGFEMAVAVEFHRRIDLPNFMNLPPETWVPGLPDARPDIRQLLLATPGEESPCESS